MVTPLKESTPGERDTVGLIETGMDHSKTHQMSSNRLAINIGLKDNTLEHVGIHGERESPMPESKAISPMGNLGDDPEQVILMQILAKMLKRHKFTGQTQKTEYMKHRPRQWETIEDKLKTLDFESEMPPGNHDKNFKKDYVKQIKA